MIAHLIPWDSNGSMETVMAWINAGAIGTLQEVHNWTNRLYGHNTPIYPPINQRCRKAFGIFGLGPGRPALFSQLYKYGVQGAGMISAVAPWQTWATIVCGRFFNALKLTSPTIIEPNRSHVCAFMSRYHTELIMTSLFLWQYGTV